MKTARRLVFTNRKGGVGKTTTSVNVAAALAHMGFQVLLVDTDPQAHATMSLGIAQTDLTGDVSDVALGRAEPSRVLRTTYVPRLRVLPSSRHLGDFERRYAGSLEARFWLKKQLEAEMDRYDFTVFDTPPTTQLLTLGSLIAGTEAYVPMQAHFLAMEGMIEIIELVEQTRRHYNPVLAVRGIIPTFFDESADFSESIMSELKARLGERVVLKPVRHNRLLAEAPGSGHTIFQHSLRSEAALDYYRVAMQIRNLGPAGGDQ